MSYFLCIISLLYLGVTLNAQEADALLLYSYETTASENVSEKLFLFKPNSYYYVKQIANYSYYDRGTFIYTDSTLILNTDEPNIVGIRNVYTDTCGKIGANEKRKIILKNLNGEFVFSCILINNNDTLWTGLNSDTIYYYKPISLIRIINKGGLLSESFSVPINATIIQVEVNTKSKDSYSRLDMYNRLFFNNKKMIIVNDNCIKDEWDIMFYRTAIQMD